MPKAVSKKQYRFMQAIIHGKGFDHPRGTPPKDIAEKYTSPGKDAAEQSGEDRGGDWNKHKAKKKDKKEDKEKKDVKKSFEEYYKSQGAGAIVINEDGNILVGKDTATGQWAVPGGFVDAGEDFAEAAHRELREEANIVSQNMIKLGQFRNMGNESQVFLVDSFKGTPKDTASLKEIQFIEPHVLADKANIRQSTKLALKEYFNNPLNKSNLRMMLASEKLEKNILRGSNGREAVFDVTHGDALRLVGNGCFRMLQNVTSDMTDEDFRDIKIDNCIVSIRKHGNDMYSGRISDGHKVIHQFSHKSLPQLCADVMSVFEWYSDEDEHVFDILDEEHLKDDIIHGGLQTLSENFKRHNLANIYTEMENIREEIRQGNAVDLQQVEDKMMKLFDKLENMTHTIISQHNKLNEDSGTEIEMLEEKLRQLASKVDELHNKPSTVEAYQSKPVDHNQIYNNHYMYMTRPSITIGQDGKIVISFDKSWTGMDKSNFLNDMKAKVLKKNK